ncbi:MAG: VOC family protein [Rhodospirillaceae bacterium]|nr:VOC family protein [Rhodospirillaceae bacterium]
MLRYLIASLLMSAPASAADDNPNVQALLLRAVTVTCKLDESIAFYRDILGQKVIQERDFTADVAKPYVDVSDKATVRLVVMEGRGEYPGGPIMGGRVAFMGVIGDPDGPACRDLNNNAEEKLKRGGRHGEAILPFRVSSIDEIAKRLAAKGYRIGFQPRPSPVGVSRNMIAYDPNGVILELFETNIAPLAPMTQGVTERMPIR